MVQGDYDGAVGALDDKNYGMLSHYDIGICPDCLIKLFGADWKEHAGNYDDEKRPIDFHGNTYDWFLEETHIASVLCGLCAHQCERIWNPETKKWEKQ